MVVVIEPEEQVLFFDDYLEAFAFTKDHHMLTCVAGTAIALTGPRNGVGIVQSTGTEVTQIEEK